MHHCLRNTVLAVGRTVAYLCCVATDWEDVKRRTNTDPLPSSPRFVFYTMYQVMVSGQLILLQDLSSFIQNLAIGSNLQVMDFFEYLPIDVTQEGSDRQFPEMGSQTTWGAYLVCHWMLCLSFAAPCSACPSTTMESEPLMEEAETANKHSPEWAWHTGCWVCFFIYLLYWPNGKYYSVYFSLHSLSDPYNKPVRKISLVSLDSWLN